jgi:hypothetical protein
MFNIFLGYQMDIVMGYQNGVSIKYCQSFADTVIWHRFHMQSKKAYFYPRLLLEKMMTLARKSVKMMKMLLKTSLKMSFPKMRKR